MRNNEFMLALNALCAERDLSKEVVFDAIESALQAAYRRDFEHDPNVTVMMDRTTGAARVYVEKKVVEYVQDRRSQISIEDARRLYGPDTNVDDTIREEQTPRNFGRIAAQTAKQVILQRIREAERDRLYHDYVNRQGELVTGMVQNIDHKTRAVRLSLGKAEAVLLRSEQLPGERYRIGLRLRAYVTEVNRAHRGPQIMVSRTHRQMLRRLLELEVPEITNGTVELRSIAREPGARSKIAVAAMQAGIDPVGACVGMKGIRIQNIVNELNGEKIDVVQWNPDEAIYVANALSPAKVVDVFLDGEHEEGKTAIVVVPDKQLSLAIGKEGQNARLAAKLTGWRIDIKSSSEASEEQVRLANRQAHRHQEKSRREREEEVRLAAARALLAEAESGASLFDDDDDDLTSMTEVDEIAFGSDLFDDEDDFFLDEAEDDLLLAEEEDDLLLDEEEDDLLLDEEEPDLLLDEEEDDLLLAEEEPDLLLADEEEAVLLEEEEPDLLLADEEEAVLLEEEEPDLLLADEEEPALLEEEEPDLLLADEEEAVLLEEEEPDLLLADEEDPVLLEEEEVLVLAEEEEELLLAEEEEPVLLDEEEELLLADKEDDSGAKATSKKGQAPAITSHQQASSDNSISRNRDSVAEHRPKENNRKKKGKRSEPQSKSDGSMIFYTFNDQGEAESLDYLVERKKQGKKKKKKKKKRNNRRFK